MHATGTGPIKTLLAIGFVVVIPLIAVFGIPERESVVASSGNDGAQRLREHAVGVGESARYRSDDLFADFPHDDAVNADPDPADETLSVSVSSNDPFQAQSSTATSADDPFLSRTRSVPKSALAGWSLEPSREASPSRVGGFASRFATGPKNRTARAASPVKPTVSASGNVAAPMPEDAKAARSVPHHRISRDHRIPWGNGVSRGNRISQEKSEPKRFRHHRSKRAERQPARPTETPLAKSPMPQTWRAAVRRLNELGIHHFRLEPGRQANEFHFHCSFTPSDTPRITQRFEAEAVEPLRAVQKVIAQVEQWLQRR